MKRSTFHSAGLLWVAVMMACNDDVAASADAAQQPALLTCDAPTVVLQEGSKVPSGFVRCANGLLERVSSEPIARDDFGATPCGEDDDLSDVCAQHSDCGALEVCIFGYGGELECACSPTCRSDDDCEEDEACLSAPFASDGASSKRSHARCIPAKCRSNADCESGHCVLSLVQEACSITAELACMDDDSACFVDADCPKGDYACNVSQPIDADCQPGRASSWSCRPSESDCQGLECG